MKIFRNGKQIHDLAIDDKTTIKRRLMVENSLNLSVAVAVSSPLDLKIGDYTDLGSERYIIMDDPTYSLRNGVYDYDVLMRGNLHRLEVYMMPDEGRDEWFYYGSIVDQINKVVDILNTKEVGWSVVLPNITELSNIAPKDINYANMSILSAFHAICSAESGWGLEFDVVGKTIIFGKDIKNPTQMRFEHGKGKGLYELSRGKTSGEKIATRIIGYGGKANMPNGQRLDFSDINGGNNYIDKNIDKYGLRESRVNFDHIYPRLKDATITSNAVQVQAGKANWTVKTALDFDLTQQVLDDSVIVFQTGDCAGVEFKIVAYDHATKTITFTEDANESGVEVNVLPNAKRYPKAGDQYVLINILMPDSYVTNAKNELKVATIAEADRIAIPQRSYSVKCDPRYFKALGVTPLVGDGVRIIDAPHGVDYVSRIIEINYPVIYPHNIEMVLADKIPIPGTVVLSKSVNDAKNKVAALDRSKLTENQLSKMYHPLGGDLAKPLAMSEQRLASVDGGYVVVKSGFLDGVGAEDPPISGGDGGTTDYADLTNKPQINGIALVGNKTLAELGAQPLIPANTYALFGHGHTWESVTNKPTTWDWSLISNKPTTFTPSAHNQAISTITDLQTTLNGKASLNGSLTQPFAMSALRLANSGGYIEIKSGFLDGVGAPNPPAGGGDGGTTDYVDLTNKPQINGIALVGNKTLAELGVQPLIPANTYALFGHGHTWESVTNKPTMWDWSLISNKPTTFTPSAHNHTWLRKQDTRGSNLTPAQFYSSNNLSGIELHFKANGVDGLTDGGAFHGNLLVAPYSDSSGGPMYQLGFTPNNNLWMRKGNTTSWDNWVKFYHSDNLAPASTEIVANTLAQRDVNGFLNAVAFKSDYSTVNLSIGEICYRRSQADGYHHFCTPDHFKAQLGLWSTNNFDPNSKLNINLSRGINADNSLKNEIWFDYSFAGSGYAGSVISFSGLDSSYATQLFGTYQYSGNYFYVRTHNGDTGTWNPARLLWTDGNSNLATVDWSMRNATIAGSAIINGTATIGNCLRVNPTNENNYTEGIRISGAADGFSLICFNTVGYSGSHADQWMVGKIDNGTFVISNDTKYLTHPAISITKNNEITFSGTATANGFRVKDDNGIWQGSKYTNGLRDIDVTIVSVTGNVILYPYSGNVGIGINNPTAKLHVNGKAKCDSLIINNYNASGVVNGTSEIISKDYA